MTKRESKIPYMVTYKNGLELQVHDSSPLMDWILIDWHNSPFNPITYTVRILTSIGETL